MPGLDRVAVQNDFSGGMFRGVREDLIPANGCFDITNGLLDNSGLIYRRGGSTFRSNSPFGAATWLPFIWTGFLWDGTVQRTVVASTNVVGTLNADGSFTSLGGTGVPRPRRATVMQGKLYLPGGFTYDGATAGTAAKVGSFYAVVANRLLVATESDRVDFSNIGDPTLFGVDNFHRMPEGVQIVGLYGLRDSALVFTTGGVWVIGNMAFNLTDAAGNVQHRLDRYSSDLVLWGDAGIAAFEGGLVVPALDSVWLLSLGVASEAPQAFRIVSDQVQGLYRDYVRAGYAPGGATVFRNHYLLPILNGSQWVDTLVCRLDAPGQPWSRLGGYGAKVSMFAVSASAVAPRSPVLIGAPTESGRVMTLSYFDPGPGVERDADNSAFSWSVQPRDYPTGPLNKNTMVRLRMGYELSDPLGVDPVITATQFSGSQPPGATLWGRFTWGSSNWSPAVESDQLSGSAPEDANGYEPHTWYFAKRQRFGRFRLDCTQATSRLRLRWLELFVRSNGRM